MTIGCPLSPLKTFGSGPKALQQRSRTMDTSSVAVSLMVGGLSHESVCYLVVFWNICWGVATPSKSRKPCWTGVGLLLDTKCQRSADIEEFLFWNWCVVDAERHVFFTFVRFACFVSWYPALLWLAKETSILKVKAGAIAGNVAK